MFEYTPNRANWTYPSEEAMGHNAHPVSEKDFSPTKKEMFMCIKKDFNEEFMIIQAYLNGKLKKSIKTYNINEREHEQRLLYFAFPEYFEDFISNLDYYRGDELTPADKAWINNSLQIIDKYHYIFEEEAE